MHTHRGSVAIYAHPLRLHGRHIQGYLADKKMPAPLGLS